MLLTKIVHKIETHFIRKFFFFENLAVCENVEKYGTVRQVTGGAESK